ncbi:hypothetical protein BGZ83_000956 [Gryganskiella cystojenkinii]|nr:hypothetical protein BGZ83_000956 [Gryganskiella cystojenkinii]
MTSLEQPPSPTVGNNNNDSRPSILFTYPFPTNKDTPLPKTVQITGTFNNWGRTDPLVPNKDQSRFELSIAIETEENQQQQKILFKYVINDEDWVTDASQARERDQAGNMNNILFLDSRNATTSSTQNSTKSEETTMATQDVISTKGTKQEPTESEEDRIARLKQEEEDDATIRQLGGGMWGAPMFSVNDPVNLPEHFVDSAAPASTTADQEHEVEEKEERAQQSQNVDPSIPAIVVATAGNTQQQQKLSTETVAADRHEEEKSTVIAPTSSATAAVTPTTQEAVQEQEEDEDDKTIRMLGGGMWGTPFFKVNDPASLPEHFVEAIGATTIAEPSELEQLEVVADREEELSEGEVVRDDVSVTMEGTLIETVVETTEDTVIEDAAGNFLEETITTSVQDSVEGSVSEEVTEVVETIEDIEPADPVSVSAPASQETAVKTPLIVEENSSSEPQMTITETEVTSVGADGVETTVLEETITFVEGPEVDSSSLHSLTTGIKPIQENESVLIETLPEYNVETPPSTAGASSSSAAISAAIPVSSPLPTPSLVVAGDAKPSMDLSTATATEASTLTPISTARTSLHGDHYDGDNGAVYLHDQPVGPTPSAGDARPETDLSVQVTPATTEKKPIVVSPTTAQKPSATAKPTEKSEKRRSFWKKLKKVLS